MDNASLLGGFVPWNISSYLSLYCYLHDYSKSHFVRDIILPWYNKQKNDLPKDSLIDKISVKLQMEWDSFALKNTAMTDVDLIRGFNDYKARMLVKLTKKGIDLDIANKLIQRLKR